MDAQGDLNEGQWVAAVGFLLVLLLPLVVGAAAWLKQRYARAVVALQSDTVRSAAPVESEAAPQRAARAAVPASLNLSVSAARELPNADHSGRPGLRLRRRVLAAQFAMGLLYWAWLLLAVLLALASVTDEAGSTDPVTLRDRFSGHLLLWPLLLAPPALAWAVQAGVPERRVWAGFGLLGLCVALGLALGRTFEWPTFFGLLGFLAVTGALMVTFLRPAVRGAGPPLLAATVVGWLVLCALLALAAAIFDDGSDAGLPSARDWALFALAVAGLLLPALWAGRRMLMRLARRYGEKRFSELQLALAAYWGMVTAFALALASMAAFDDKMANAAGVGEWLAIVLLLAWWLWRLALRFVLWWATRRAPPPTGPLLFLRVFKPSSRSEAFTDRLLARWRFVAPTWMIAGPDLAGAYMEPDEFFAYLQRKLGERYITREGEIPARLTALDGARDPDGRFRVNDLYCANTTWKATVLALMEHAGVVLLDLREYGSHRTGTRFELTELLRRAPLHKVLLIIDAAQDLPSLQREVQSLWAEVAGERADAARPAPLRLLQLDDSDAALQGLIAALSDAAGSAASELSDR